MKSRRALSVSFVLLTALTLTAQMGWTQNATPLAPDVTVASEMAPAPDDCGILPESVAIDPMIPHAVGAWPIWVAVPDLDGDPRGALFFPDTHYQTRPELEGWWSSKIAWFIPVSYTGTVTLQATNVGDGSPIYFEVSEHNLATVAILDTAQPGGFVDVLTAFAFFPSNLWISKAGCYRIEAAWDGGRWEQVIAAGFMEPAIPRP